MLNLVGRVKHAIARRFYEGAKRTSSRDFARAKGSFEETASTDRDTLRARARWLHENNGIMSNIDRTIVNNSVGNGMKLQVKSGDRQLNARIEKLWERWCSPTKCDTTKRLHFGDMQRVILSQRMMDGEILIHKRYTGESENPFQITLIESDRVDASAVMPTMDQDVFVDGIIIDDFGAPKTFVLKKGWTGRIEVDASQLIHYYKNDNRASQYRGISEYKQSIIDLRNLAGYQSSVIKAARLRANVGYVVETENIQAHIGQMKQTEEHEPLYEVNGVMVEYLNPGERLTKLDPQVVGMDYDKFVKTAIRTISVARNVSYELAFRDYSEVNFSSARASIIQDHKRFSHEQFHLVTYVLRPLFLEWLEANVLAGNVDGLSASRFYASIDDFTPLWIPPKREWVDPLKDIKALEKEIDMGLTTLKKAAASRGDDIEDLISEREEEIKMLEKAGIVSSDRKPQ